MIQSKVKFTNKDKSLFYPELKDRVDAYFKENGILKTGGTKMLIKAVVMLSLYLVPYFLILSNQFSLVGMMILCVIMGIGTASVGMSVMHDANHGSFSEKPQINKFFGSTMYWLGGNVYNWKQQHNIAHHTYTNIHEHDEDITGKPFLRLCPGEAKKKMHKFQHFYAFLLYGLMTFSFLIRDFKILIGAFSRNESKPYPKNELTKLIISKIIYFILILAVPLWLVDITIWNWLAGYVILHFTAGFIMSVIFQLAHVVEGANQPVLNFNGNIDDAWAVHQISTTANFSGNSIVSYFIGGLDYQIEHHLFPTISHVHYKALSEIVRNTATSFNIPYNNKNSLIHAIGSHYSMLKALGR